jgi:uncharacterized protein (DUF2252 family)
MAGHCGHSGGSLWEEEIKKAIAESVFFIPVVTPNAVRSKHCKLEFESFLKREGALGRNNLIFPILYVPVPGLEKKEEEWRRDDVLKIIGERQYMDWQRFRVRSLSESEVAERIVRYCGKIVLALRQPWVSPKERGREVEAKARQQAQEELQAKRRAEEEDARKQAEAEAQQHVVQSRKPRRTPRDAQKASLKQLLAADAKGRAKNALAKKRDLMRESFWNFFRGDPAFLYSKISPDELSLGAPAGWLAGALHLESFGSYLSDTGVVFFDVLDFDETILAPCTWDLLHFCVAVLVASDRMRIQMSTARKIANTFLKSFSRTLVDGVPGMELPVSSDLIKGFLRNARRRGRKKYYEERIWMNKRKRFQIRLDNGRAAELAKGEKADIIDLFDRISRKNDILRGVEIHDAAERWIGIRGLGWPRYILVGEREADVGAPFLIELEYIAPSSLLTWVDYPQPNWPNEATKVAAVEARVRPARSDLAVPIQTS